MNRHANINPSVNCQTCPLYFDWEESTSGTIEVPEIQRMRVVCLPGRKEHGEYRNQRSECANLGRTVSNRCRLEQTCQCAVQRVDAMAISISLEYGRVGLYVTYSNSSPRGLDVPVRRACFPSMLSMVEYLTGSISAMLHVRKRGERTSTCRTRNCSKPKRGPALQSASSSSPYAFTSVY
jgi:hypothetical protein